MRSVLSQEAPRIHSPYRPSGLLIVFEFRRIIFAMGAEGVLGTNPDHPAYNRTLIALGKGRSSRKSLEALASEHVRHRERCRQVVPQVLPIADIDDVDGADIAPCDVSTLSVRETTICAETPATGL